MEKTLEQCQSLIEQRFDSFGVNPEHYVCLVLTGAKKGNNYTFQNLGHGKPHLAAMMIFDFLASNPDVFF